MLGRMNAKNTLSILVLSLACLATSSPACAAGPETLGTFGFWNAYKMAEGDQTVCYMSLSTRPPADKNQKSKRGEVVLMITHRPADNSTDVVSYTAGLKFKAASEATVTAGKETFHLFTQGDTAWSRDAATDHALAKAIRNNASLTINGQTSRDTALADKLNLKGSFEAYVAINKACGLPVPSKPKAAAKPKAKPTSSSKDKKTKAKQR